MTDHAESSHEPHTPDEHAHAHEHHEGDGHGHDAAPEKENLPVAKVAMVGVLCLSVFFVGGVWAMKIRSDTLARVSPSGPSALPVHFGAEEQGIVDQIPFELNHWVKDQKAQGKSQLHGYAWVDRKEQLIRIPIERAIELELSHTPAPATAAPANRPASIPPQISPATTTAPTAPSIPLVPTTAGLKAQGSQAP